MTAIPRVEGPLKVFLIAGEESGDALGAGLMEALDARVSGGVRYLGIGGARMARYGLTSIFPMEELALHGLTEVVARLPRLWGRINETVAAVLEAEPLRQQRVTQFLLIITKVQFAIEISLHPNSSFGCHCFARRL